MNLGVLLLQVAIVLVAARLLGLWFGRAGQPQVIGEMVAGILLGPSLVGWALPAWSAAVFPPASLGYLNALSQVGLVVFMFLVGVGLHTTSLRAHGRTAVSTSLASVAVPFVLGSLMAAWLHADLAQPGVSKVVFALFMGTAMSITAFPVLARILAERGLLSSPLGSLAIACAAVDDIVGWCLLAGIVALVHSETTASTLWPLAGALIYVAVMALAIRPLLRRFETAFRARGEVTVNALSLMTALAMLSGMATERLGIHAVFGAFFAGALMPKDEAFTRAVLAKLEPLAVSVLLPLFFAFSGLRTDIGLVHGGRWGYAALIVAVAIAGKLCGSMAGARLGGASWRDAASLGILMNTRGLMELVALNIGLDIGVITPQVFTMMVLMALVTTFLTSPLLAWVRPAGPGLERT